MKKILGCVYCGVRKDKAIATRCFKDLAAKFLVRRGSKNISHHWVEMVKVPNWYGKGIVEQLKPSPEGKEK